MNYERIKQTLKYILPFFVGLLLYKKFYDGVSIQQIKEHINDISWTYFFLALSMHIINHLLRALRWKWILATKQKKQIPLYNFFYIEMGGYFVNALFPRFGDFFRCEMLKKKTGTKLKTGLRVEIIDRIIDIATFIGICTLTLLFGIKTISRFLYQIILEALYTITLKKIVFIIIVIYGIILILTSNYEITNDYIYQPLRNLLSNLETLYYFKQKRFWLLNLLIWLSYFAIDYLTLHSLTLTSHLNLYHAFSIFIIINFVKMIPVPGNLGTYHIVLKRLLLLFGIAKTDAVLFVTISYFVQQINGIFIGLPALFYHYFSSAYIPEKRTEEK